MMDYLKINKDSWNQRVEPHLVSDFYNVEAFKKGKSSLNSIELDLLGDVSGKSILHLQCHFGQDTMSLSRMGAKCVGVDFSDKAIQSAEEIRDELALDTRFICQDILSLDSTVLNEKFDIVFTSYGTIGWLPDINKWAEVVRSFLKDDGQFVIAEFHPVIWMFDDDVKKVTYSYFNRQVIEETEEGSYTDKSEHLRTKFLSWNHSLTEVFNALKSNGMQMTDFHEFDYSPYNCFKDMVEPEAGRFMIKGNENKFPMVYSMRWKV
jgi:ubiquinone/menaquinone biosynthesis C-methylase UbiE